MHSPLSVLLLIKELTFIGFTLIICLLKIILLLQNSSSTSLIIRFNIWMYFLHSSSTNVIIWSNIYIWVNVIFFSSLSCRNLLNVVSVNVNCSSIEESLLVVDIDVEEGSRVSVSIWHFSFSSIHFLMICCIIVLYICHLLSNTVTSQFVCHEIVNMRLIIVFIRWKGKRWGGELLGVWTFSIFYSKPENLPFFLTNMILVLYIKSWRSF